MTIVVRQATADEVRPLRRGVLRPGSSLAPAPYDLRAETLHIGAFEADKVVGCATVFPEPLDDDVSAWRLRGMAVDPTYQGRGIGRQVLDAAVVAAEGAGASLLWATGRVSAMAFYQQFDWVPVGEVFEYGPENLPHYLIVHRREGH